MQTTLKALWHDYFPPRCVLCAQAAVGFLCAECGAKCRAVEAHCVTCSRVLHEHGVCCGQCLRESPPIDAFWAAKRFDASVRQVILAMKFGRSRTAAVVAQNWLRERAQHLDLPNDVVVMPLPLSFGRLMMRGFNQADGLAEVVAKSRDWSLKRGILRRNFRPAQALIKTHRGRKHNIQSAFYVVGVVPKKVLLIDDVVTSGATVHEAAKTLKQHGAEWVGVLCVATKQR